MIHLTEIVYINSDTSIKLRRNCDKRFATNMDLEVFRRKLVAITGFSVYFTFETIPDDITQS